MQLMTEQKLDHRNHHLDAHQQQHYHHPTVEPTQERLNALGALANNTTPQQQQHHQHLAHIQDLNQTQLGHPSNQQQTLNTAASNYQQSAALHHHAPRLAAQQLSSPTVNHSSNNNTNSSSNDNNNTNTSSTTQTCSPLTAPPIPVAMSMQPTSFTKNHLIGNNGTNMPLSAADELSIRKRREELSRRPSYKRIFNDITGLSGALEPPPTIAIGQLAPPAAPNRHSPQSITTGSQQPNNSPGPQAIDLLNSVAVSAAMQDPTATSQSPVSVVDLQTNTPTSQLAQQHQLQQHHHQQQQHHQHHLPSNHLQQQRHHHHQQSQEPRQSQPHQMHQIQAAISPPIIGGVVTEEASKKRELRLQKNREAAKECRRKKKEYIKCLENRVAVLENQNKALIDELKTLKDLYCKSTTE